jgi:hypothetical protein
MPALAGRGAIALLIDHFCPVAAPPIFPELREFVRRVSLDSLQCSLFAVSAVEEGPSLVLSA